MLTYRHSGSRSLVLILFLVVSSTALGQQENPALPSRSNPVATAASSGDTVRFTTPGNVTAMRVEIYAATGEKMFDSGKQEGNVLDWRWQDRNASALSTGSYLCVVTVQSLSGKTSRKLASISVDNKQVTIQRVEAAQLNPAQTQALGSTERDTPLTILDVDQTIAATVVAHDGNDGQITRTRGALSFRLGDFFSGKDEEQMRLTEEGNLGIGTDKPQAKLDVAGMIRTSKGIEFDNGTDGTKVTKLTATATGSLQQTLADGTVVPNATGTGTQNKLAKWIDNAGTLGDSVVTEASGNIGIGTSSPQAALHVIGNQFLKPVGATPTYQVLAGSDPTSTVMLTTDSSAFGWQIAPSNAASDTIVQVLGQSFASVPNRGEFGIYLGVDSNSAFKVIQRGGPELMRVNRAGDVGIGNTAPGAKLDVTGNINTSTQYSIGGSRILSGAGTNNFFAGFGAGAVNTGTDNSFFGFNAGNANTTAGRNSFFGSLAGSSNNTGAENSFFGYKAGTANTTGIRNSAFGGFAGNANTTGNDNAFFGYIAGRFNTTGGANAFFGTSAGAANTTGATNSFFGRSAGEKSNTGSDNSFFGALAGFANTTGARNSVFGSFAAGNFAIALTASDNSFFGYQVGFNNTSGAANTFFGSNAGNTNTTGSNNSFFGIGAGTSNTAENSNTFIGASANGVASITNATAIGANALVAQSDSLVLGSINGVNGATADTNVGIGTTRPEQRLSVDGAMNIDQGNQNSGTPSFALSFGHASGEAIGSKRTAGGNQFGLDFYTLFTNRMSINQNGDVGVGTTSPSARLDVRDGSGGSGSGGHVQIGALVANADEKLILFGSPNCLGPCVSIGEQDAAERMVLRASTFRVRGGNWDPDIDNSQLLGESGKRWSQVWAANGTIQTSDARLKQRIANLRYGLNQVMQLRPVTFQWKDGSDRRTHLGLLAQEVERVMPEMIERGTDASQPLGMNYNNLIPVLIKGIQEQQGALERNQVEIKYLRAENDALSKRIVALEQSRRRTH